MKKVLVWIASFLTVISFSGALYAQERGTVDEAKKLAEKAATYAKSAGTAKAFEEFSNKGAAWQSKDLYVFAIKFDGETVAHGANKGLIGKNLIEMKDANGKLFFKEMIDTAKEKGSGWVDYMFTDPTTKKIAPKTSYVIHVSGYDGLVGVGVYK